MREGNVWSSNYIEYNYKNLRKSSKSNDEERVMHSKSDNTELMISNNTDEVIEEFVVSLLNRY